MRWASCSTIVLGVVGAFLATFIGQTVGWYRADQGAGFIAATVGAIAVLFIWNRLVASGTAARSRRRAPVIARRAYFAPSSLSLASARCAAGRAAIRAE